MQASSSSAHALTKSDAVWPVSGQPEDHQRERRQEDARQREDVAGEDALAAELEAELQHGELYGVVLRQQRPLRRHVADLPRTRVLVVALKRLEIHAFGKGEVKVDIL